MDYGQHYQAKTGIGKKEFGLCAFCAQLCFKCTLREITHPQVQQYRLASFFAIVPTIVSVIAIYVSLYCMLKDELAAVKSASEFRLQPAGTSLRMLIQG